MANNFDLFFRRVLIDEGSQFEDVPGDNGGPTKCGITIADVARWNGVKCPTRGGPGWDDLVAKVRALTPETAGPIYKKFYWDAMRADDLPAGLDYASVDYATNSGVGRAIPTLGRLVGIPKAKAVDDAMLQAIAQYGDIADLINHFQDERKEFLEQIAEQPHNRKFRRGWLEREARVRKVALELDHNSAERPMVAVAPKAKAMTPDDASSVSTSSIQPNTTQAAMTVVKTAYSSRSIWAVISGVASMVFGVLTDWAKQGWDWLTWVLDIAPKVKGEVDEVISPIQEMAAWFGTKIGTFATTLAAICVVVFVWRHLQLKLEAQSKGTAQ